ncbi:MAG: sodium-dependent transporter, partial [Xanthomonadales bacterium]|nr:sodium-dependent transporter [Xanthomonadales bacterium]
MTTEFKQHENWTSRFGFLMAAIGAAVGLGNIWKFPYLAGQNGGGAFVLVYLGAVAFVAIPILIAEIMLGRMGKQSPPRAMQIVATRQGRSKTWSLVGWLGQLSAYMIATYYSVIAGWTVIYIVQRLAGQPRATHPLARRVHGHFGLHPGARRAERDRNLGQDHDADPVRAAAGHGGL